MRTVLSIVVVLSISAVACAGDYVLKIEKIQMLKTPQSGDWSAGVSVWQEAEKDNRDSWHGGESKYEGTDAVLPVKLELAGLNAGEQVSVFIGLDDDGEDAGGENAEDKITVSFKVFPTGPKVKVYDRSTGDWNMKIHYTLTK